MPQGEGACLGMVDGCGNDGQNRGRGRLVGARGQDIRASGGHADEDFGSLGRGFPSSIDDLRQSGAQGAVMVDAGMADVFEGKVGEAFGGLFGGQAATFDRG